MKGILNGFGNVLGWAFGLAFLWFMAWITGRMVEWSFYHTWVSYTVVIVLWISLYAWWYNTIKKREHARNAAILRDLIDDLRDKFTDVDEYMIEVIGIERN